MAELIKLSDYQNNTTDSSETAPGFRIKERNVYSENLGTRRSISTERLYPLTESGSSIIATAHKLLDEAEEHAFEGLQAIQADDRISADDHMQHIKALLPELFCCRDLGDSFATIVTSMHHALLNTGGEPLSMNQMLMIKFSISKLKNEPFLSYRDALSVVDDLVNSGLTVEPAELEFLSDILDV